MLTNTEVQVAAAVIVCAEIAGTLERQPRLRRRREVRGAADEPGHALCDRIQDLARRLAATQTLLVRWEARDLAVPPVRQLAPLHLQQLVSQLGLFLRIGREQLHPLVARLLSTRTDARGEALVHTVRHQELRVLGPAIVPFRRLDLVLAERLAVRAAGVLLVRRAVADMAVDDDQRRPLLF